MFDKTNGPIYRTATIYNPTTDCPIPLGYFGQWLDANESPPAFKIRLASGADVAATAGADGVSVLVADFACTAVLSGAPVYDNGVLGVGASLTRGSNGTFAAQDGQSFAVGKLALLTAQAAPEQNGLYLDAVLGGAGAKAKLVRVAELDEAADFIDGLMVAVRAGTSYADSTWKLTAAVGTVGTDAVTFARDPGVLLANAAQVNTGAKDFAAGTLKADNDSTTNAHTLVSAATAARTFTLPDASITPATRGAAPSGSTDVPSATAAPAFTGTAPAGAVDLAAPAFSGTGQSSAGQVVTTTDNQTMTLNQCAGMWFVSATHGPYLIASNTAVAGAQAVLTIYGTAPTTDAGTYKIVRGPTPAGSVAAVPTATHTHAAGTLTQA